MTTSNTKQYDQSVSGITTGNVSSKLLFLLVGGGIGAAVALLFAPKPGVDLRTDISDLTKKGYNETLELAHQLKEQSAEVYHTLKEKTDKVYDLAAARFSRANGMLDDQVEMAADKINGEIHEIENAAQKNTGTGRRSSSIV